MAEINGYLLTKEEEKACIELIKKLRERKMWDFLFEDVETGEQFFVETTSLLKAEVILQMSGFEEGQYEFLGKYTVEEAEILGYDTY